MQTQLPSSRTRPLLVQSTALENSHAAPPWSLSHMQVPWGDDARARATAGTRQGWVASGQGRARESNVWRIGATAGGPIKYISLNTSVYFALIGWGVRNRCRWERQCIHGSTGRSVVAVVLIGITRPAIIDTLHAHMTVITNWGGKGGINCLLVAIATFLATPARSEIIDSAYAWGGGHDGVIMTLAGLTSLVVNGIPTGSPWPLQDSARLKVQFGPAYPSAQIKQSTSLGPVCAVVR